MILMTDQNFEIEFTPTEKQTEELQTALKVEGEDAYFKLRTKYENEFKAKIKAKIDEAVQAELKKQNTKDQSALFDKYQKQYPKLKVDNESVRASVPAHILAEFDKGDIKLEELIRISIGTQQAVQNIKNPKAESKTDNQEESDNEEEDDNSGDPENLVNAPNLNDVSGSAEIPQKQSKQPIFNPKSGIENLLFD